MKPEPADPPSSEAKDLVVFDLLRESKCADCGKPLLGGDFLFMEGERPLCLTCADLDHLVHLPRGDTALTRRARKHSRLSAVVVRFSRARKRYERQGVLVEEDALASAEQQCLADEEARARRRERDALRRAEEDVELQEHFAAQSVRLFPGCPADRADAIARHAALRGSGRVGRSTAGRAVEARAVELAVIASIRHRDTAYDQLLMRGVDRADAREQVRDDVDNVPEGWRRGSARRR